MKHIIGIKTELGVLKGRDIHLDSILRPNETELVLIGELSTDTGFKPYEIKFSGIIYLRSIELDFDDKGFIESFGIIKNSVLLQRFKEADHSSKINSLHKHFYFRTYDTVFEIVAKNHILLLN